MTGLKEQLNRAVKEEAQAKDEFDAADKAWETALKRQWGAALNRQWGEYDEATSEAARLEGAVICRKGRYEYRQGARYALEVAVRFAQDEAELAKKLENVEFFSEETA